MALSGTERTQARLYLGYANLHRYLNVRLESAFDAVDTDAETVIRGILVELASVDAVLAAAGQVVAAQGTLKKADEVEFYQLAAGHSNGSGALIRGRMLVTRLSTMLGVPLYGDYFGEDGYAGDTFSEFGLLGNQGANRRGGTIPLG